MGKYKFSYAERYAVWLVHQKRCWLCGEPLRVFDTTIDHFLPECLIDDDEQRSFVYQQYGLQENFQINGFENWLPCHIRCNQIKGRKVLDYTPMDRFVLQNLIEKAPLVLGAVESVTKNAKLDQLFSKIFSAIERKEFSREDLEEVFNNFFEMPTFLPEDMLLLEGGYWVLKKDLAREGLCECELNQCVGSQKKVHCYFRPELSEWVVNKGLYWKCYDEIVECPRCDSKHKRGHIGKKGVCGKPYADQKRQRDF